MRVHITDAETQRWEVPYNLLPREQPPRLQKTIGRKGKNSVTVSEYSGSELIFSCIADPFGFAVRRKSNGETLFNSSADGSDPFGSLVFKDQYLEIDFHQVTQRRVFVRPRREHPTARNQTVSQ